MTPHQPKKFNVAGYAARGWRFAVAGAALSGLALNAQEAPAPDSTSTPDQKVVELPVFSVNDTRSSAYGAQEAISTTRISVPIQDVPQTVSVVTRELMDDTAGNRILDVAKYVTPVTQSTLSSGGDRMTLRGFQVSQRFVDGVNISGVDGYNMASATSNIERLEIIKGPNAILVPGGSPGGIMNQITKSPKFKDHTELSLTFKEYLNREASADVNRVFNKGNSAVRLVASVWDGDGFFRDQFRKGWLVAPSFTHVFSNGAQFTTKLEILYNKESSGAGGVFIDPSVGYGETIRVWPNTPLNLTVGPQSGANADIRVRNETRWVNELNFKLGEVISSRLWLMADHAERDDTGAPSAVSALGDQGTYSPVTGQWTPFITYGPGPTFTPIVATPNYSRVFRRVGQANLITFDELHFKNDYAAEIMLPADIKSTTIVGLSANYQKLSWKNWSNTRTPLDLSLAEPNWDAPIIASNLLRDKKAAQQDLQVFAYERLTLLDERLILAGGASQFWGVLERLDNGNLPAVVSRSVSNSVTDYNLGVIVKPVKTVSVYAGYNKVGGALPSSILAGETAANFLVQSGEQLEFGVKTTFFDGRLTAALSHFDITQNNFQVPNSLFNTDPTQPQFFFQDLQSKGWEFETTYMVTQDLVLVGNVSDYKMRSALGVRQRTVADRTAALFAKYAFSKGVMKGFSMQFGADYTGDMAGEQVSGYVTGTLVPKQPRYYFPSRTIYNAGIGYKFTNWTVAVNVDNIFDKYDFTAGVPVRNWAFTGRYTF